MFEQILSRPADLNRHRNGPYAAEREHYLALLMAEGRSRSVLCCLTGLLYRMAKHLPLDRHLTLSDIKTVARQWAATGRWAEKNRHTAEAYFTFHAIKWLRSLGRLQEPASQRRFAQELDAFLRFEEQERDLALASLVRENSCLRSFFHWAAGEVETLNKITPDDISRYFSWQATHHRWKRTTYVSHVIVLRNFFRFAESRNWCVRGLADTIDSPRIYKLEHLPRGPQWHDVQRLIAASSGDAPTEVRDYAMLLLVSVYGFRNSEVRNLTLDDIDWEQEIIRVHRSKQRKTQRYPLVQTVGEAILRYLRKVRPSCSRREIFLSQHQPFRPLTAVGLSAMVRRRLLKLGLVLPSYGPHALRHACATHLLAEGFSLKEIADHLGHVSLSATQIYAKVDVTALREVGQLDISRVVAYAERSARRATPIYAKSSLEAHRAVAAISLGGLL